MTTTVHVTPASPPSLEVGSEEVVRIRGLTKRFPVVRSWAEMLRHPLARQYTTALDGVSLSVRHGEFFGLLGPNGAGKTTLFKILSTLILPDGGSAVVAGLDIRRDARRIRHVLTPVIPEERSLNWRLSAWENLALYAALHGLKGAELRKRLAELLEVVELQDAGHKIVAKFSSGMKQRLLIARALLSRPRVLLLDEPTRSLDPLSARRFRRFLQEQVVSVQGCTVLLATHNAEEALELCDRVGILHQGRLLAVGQAEVLARQTGDHRYHLVTRHAHVPAVAALREAGLIHSVANPTAELDGWVRLEVTVPRSAEQAAAVVARLVELGVPVARFERIPFTLADLIERVVNPAAAAEAHV